MEQSGRAGTVHMTERSARLLCHERQAEWSPPCPQPPPSCPPTPLSPPPTLPVPLSPRAANLSLPPSFTPTSHPSFSFHPPSRPSLPSVRPFPSAP